MSVEVGIGDRAAVCAALADRELNWGPAYEAAVLKHGEGVAGLAKALRDEAIDTAVDWKRTQAMDNGIAAINARARASYPWLSDDARSALVQAFVMRWK